MRAAEGKLKAKVATATAAAAVAPVASSAVPSPAAAAALAQTTAALEHAQGELAAKSAALSDVQARLSRAEESLLEQTRVNDEIWLPKSERLWLSARVALLKNYHIEEDTTFQNYKKFSAQSRIVSASPASSAPR